MNIIVHRFKSCKWLSDGDCRVSFDSRSGKIGIIYRPIQLAFINRMKELILKYTNEKSSAPYNQQQQQQQQNSSLYSLDDTLSVLGNSVYDLNATKENSSSYHAQMLSSHSVNGKTLQHERLFQNLNSTIQNSSCYSLQQQQQQQQQQWPQQRLSSLSRSSVPTFSSYYESLFQQFDTNLRPSNINIETFNIKHNDTSIIHKE
ncbi:unnamed protein product, partial [Didymodactylos carnosus]